MAQEPPRPLPASAVQATGQVASDVVAGLKGQPMLLGIVVLNIIGIGIAGWIGLRFLEQAERGDAADRAVMQDMLKSNREAFREFLNLCFPDHRYSERGGREDRAPITQGGPR